MIAVWGLRTDSPCADVLAELEAMRVPRVFIDQRLVLSTGMHTVFGATVAGCLDLPGERVDLEDVSAIYLRAHESATLAWVAATGPASSQTAHAQAIDALLWTWADVASSYVVNRPSAMTSNCSKPGQLAAIRAAGFRVPETLVTTDPERARLFWAQQGEVIYKSVSGIRSMVRRLDRGEEARLDSVRNCPTQFQEYIRGVDHRVHVVLDEVFATEVVSAADDYRYAETQVNASAELRAVRLPRDVQHRCRTLAAALELPVAGIDLRRTPDGEWVCFEVNPSPAFSYYQHHTGQPIARAIAEILTDAGTMVISEGTRQVNKVSAAA